MSDTLQIMLSCIASISVIVGPMLVIFVQRNIKIGQMRKNWIEELRNLVARYVAKMHSLGVYKSKSTPVKEFAVHLMRINEIQATIALMLNDNEKDHVEFLNDLKRLYSEAVKSYKGKESKEDYLIIRKRVFNLGRKILKKEWEVVKGFEASVR